MTILPKAILELIERFDQNHQAYHSAPYNETQLRREFLDPFFEALGWDVNNRQGYAEAYKDVIHEDAIRVGGVTKAPDYCFRIGGTRKFFIGGMAFRHWVRPPSIPSMSVKLLLYQRPL